MSDFDEEAERERLRERFEAEDEKRAATERMSELLLKGATMTNAHCSECGDPVFRYDGQEFCASCERPIERDDLDDAESDPDQSTNVQVTSPSEDAHVRFGGADEADAADEPDAAGEPAGAGEEPEATEPDPPDVDQPRRDSTPERTAREPADRPPERDTEPAGSPDSGTPEPRSEAPAGGVESARRDLAATLARFARAARDSESPQAAVANLEAAEAAAETLDDLD